MFEIFTIVYLGAWLLTAVGTFVAGRLLADPDIPVANPLVVSLFAGAVWPLTILGAVELTSVAAYSKAKSKRADAEIHAWMLDDGASDIVVPLR